MTVNELMKVLINLLTKRYLIYYTGIKETDIFKQKVLFIYLSIGMVHTEVTNPTITVWII